MSYCPNCGAKRKENSKFCHNCGFDFAGTELVKENIGDAVNNSPNSGSEISGVYSSGSDFNINRGYNSNNNTNTNNPVNVNQNSHSSNSNFNHSNPVNVNQNSHRLAKVLGYVFSVLIPLIGIIIGIYLILSENQEVHKHGVMIIIISIFIQLLSFISVML